METLYQNLVNEIADLLPQNWGRVVMYSQITQNSYEIFFYVKKGEGYISVYNLEEETSLSKRDIRAAFKKIYELLLPDQIEKNWFCMTFILTKEGFFKVEYDYEDHSTNTLSYKSQWKSKYLID